MDTDHANSQGDYNPYRGIFSTTISIAGTQQSALRWLALPAAGKRNWVWVGEEDSGDTRVDYSVWLCRRPLPDRNTTRRCRAVAR